METRTARPACPRCGAQISWLEKQLKGSRVYYVAVHYLGSKEGKRRVKKCYLGPEEYDYVSRLHRDIGITLEGAIKNRRVIHYLDAFLASLPQLELDRATLLEIADKLAKLSSKLREYGEKLESGGSQEES